MKTKKEQFNTIREASFPAYIQLASGEKKLSYTAQDAISWVCQKKQDVISVTSMPNEKYENVPSLERSSNEDVVENHLLLGGDLSDFTDEFLKECGSRPKNGLIICS